MLIDNVDMTVNNLLNSLVIKTFVYDLHRCALEYYELQNILEYFLIMKAISEHYRFTVPEFGKFAILALLKTWHVLTSFLLTPLGTSASLQVQLDKTEVLPQMPMMRWWFGIVPFNKVKMPRYIQIYYQIPG